MFHESIPSFEGHPVDGTKVKMSGTVPLADLDGEVIGVDDVVQLITQYRCSGVHHETDKDGKLVRVQVLKPIEAVCAPFDPSDPNDKGIIRALATVRTSPGNPQLDSGGDDE